MKTKKIITLLSLIAFMTLGVKAQTQTPFIKVSASAQGTVQPNVIEITIELSEEPSKGKVTLKEQETRLAKALKRAEIDATKQLTILSKTLNTAKKDDSYGYANYLLTLSSVEQCNKVFEAFEKEGVTRARIKRTGNTDIEEFSLSLSAEALQKAQKIAETLAESLNQTIGKAIEIEVYSGGSSAYEYSNGMMMRASAKSMDGAGSVTLPEDLEVNPISVSRNVTVKFELK